MGPLSYSIVVAAACASSAIAAPTKGQNQDNLARDLKTLQDFAKTVTVDPNNTLSDWTGDNVCKFKGVTCAKTPEGYNAVAGIDLNQAGLGENLRVDGLLDKLLDLTFFHANSNNFTGTIPDVSKLKYLYEIDVSNNGMSGNFPKEVFDAPLTFLDLRFNQFTGEFPEELFTKTDMDVIFLNDNQFTGEIPKTGNISTPYITLANNKLTGTIPADLANNKGLKEILLLGNQLTGGVPEELCELKLDVLDVSNNQLTEPLGEKCKKLLDAGVLNVNGTQIDVTASVGGDKGLDLPLPATN